MDSPYELLAVLAFVVAVLAVAVYWLIGRVSDLHQKLLDMQAELAVLQTGGGKTAGVTRLEKRRSS